MRTRLIAHTLLLLSILLFSAAMANVYGGQVKAHDHQKNQTAVDRIKPVEPHPDAQVESLRFEHRLKINDTATITVRNLGNIPIRIRDILINDITHAPMIEGYIFDKEGNFYFGSTIPPGGFAILKTDTHPEDLKPTDHNYNITMKTNIGQLHETFQINSKTYTKPSAAEPFAPYFLTLMIGSVVSVYYYARFKTRS